MKEKDGGGGMGVEWRRENGRGSGGRGIKIKKARAKPVTPACKYKTIQNIADIV